MGVFDVVVAIVLAFAPLGFLCSSRRATFLSNARACFEGFRVHGL